MHERRVSSFVQSKSNYAGVIFTYRTQRTIASVMPLLLTACREFLDSTGEDIKFTWTHHIPDPPPVQNSTFPLNISKIHVSPVVVA